MPEESASSEERLSAKRATELKMLEWAFRIMNDQKRRLDTVVREVRDSL